LFLGDFVIFHGQKQRIRNCTGIFANKKMGVFWAQKKCFSPAFIAKFLFPRKSQINSPVMPV
jgi:hypothetical protein